MVFACNKEKYCKIREKRSFYKGPVLTTGVRRKKPKLKELFNGAKTVSTVAGGGGGATPPTQQPHETRKRPFREPSDAGSDDNSFNEMKKIHSDSGKSKKWGKRGFPKIET